MLLEVNLAMTDLTRSLIRQRVEAKAVRRNGDPTRDYAARRKLPDRPDLSTILYLPSPGSLGSLVAPRVDVFHRL